MQLSGQKITGVNVELDDLMAVRGKLAGMSLSMIRQRPSVSTGVRQSRIRGRGMEYEESRAYVPGDDVRTMDWRVMARTGVAYTKVFTQEKERIVVLAIDLSASMFYGTRYGFKSWAAAQVAAHIGWIVVQSRDRLGALLASPQLHDEVKPQKNNAGLMRMFHHLQEHCQLPSPVQMGESRLNFLLTQLCRVSKPGSLVVIITDWLGMDEETESLLSVISSRSDIVSFWLHDQSEIQSWPKGRYPLLYQDKPQNLDLGHPHATNWLDRQQQKHRDSIERLATRFKMSLLPVSCNQDISPQLAQYLRR